MLIGISIVANIVVVIVGIGKEQIVFGEDKSATEIDIGEMDVLWILCGQYILIFIGKTSTRFIPQIQTGFPIPNNLGRLFYVNGSMVGGQNEFHPQVLSLLNNF